jgi:hypothetical protein
MLMAPFKHEHKQQKFAHENLPTLTWNPGSAPGQYKNKNKNVLLPIKGPQGANNLIQGLKWLETYM